MPLPTFTPRVDNVDIIHASDINELQNEVAPTAAAALAVRYSQTSTSTATILTDSSYPLQSILSTADGLVTLPAASTANHAFYIVNRSTAFTITVNNSSAAQVASVDTNSAQTIYPNGVNGWQAGGGGGGGTVESVVAGDGIAVDDTDPANPVVAIADGDWHSINATLTYNSADDPIYVVSSDTDLTDILSVGMKLNYTNNSTTFYGIIHAIGSWSGSAQLITVYGGTDYDTANSAITAPYYSTAKAPQGFPTAEDKWSVTLTNTSDNLQASPTANTVYNPGSLSIDAPIGQWEVRGKIPLQLQFNTAATSTVGARCALSTSTSSFSSTELMRDFAFTLVTSSSGFARFDVTYGGVILSVGSKTTFYIICLTTLVSTATYLGYRGTISGLYITLVDAYL